MNTPTNNPDQTTNSEQADRSTGQAGRIGNVQGGSKSKGAKSIPLTMRLALEEHLWQIGDLIGTEFEITLICRNKKRPNADIVFTEDKDPMMKAFIDTLEVTT